MINEKMLEFLCLGQVLGDYYVEGDLSIEEYEVVLARYEKLKKELISEYVKVPTQK